MYKVSLLIILVYLVVFYYLYKYMMCNSCVKNKCCDTCSIENFNQSNRPELYYVGSNEFSLNQPTYTTDGDLNDDFINILSRYNFKQAPKNGKYFFPTNYDSCEKIMKHLLSDDSDVEYIFAMDGCDAVVNLQGKETAVHNPLIIGQRNANIKVYYLMVCRPPSHSALEGYIYYDGYMYYTSPHYVDNLAYLDNPLTLNDLRKHLGRNKGDVLEDNILRTMNNITKEVSTKVCTMETRDKIRFQVFEVDIAPSADLSIKVMKINKNVIGKYVKYDMYLDMFKIIDPRLSNDKRNGFIKIY